MYYIQVSHCEHVSRQASKKCLLTIDFRTEADPFLLIAFVESV